MPASEFENLFQMFDRSVETWGSRELFGTKKQGTWTWTTYAEVGALVAALRGGLASLGIQRGDRVCLISNNRVEWVVAAYACFGLGAVLVPMYESQLFKEWAYIANDCEATAVMASTASILEQCKALQADVPSLKHVIGFLLPESDPHSYAALIEVGKQHPAPAAGVLGGDTACFIYTSGTTGNPKGVILSHKNLLSCIFSVEYLFPVGPEDRSLSFLPWAHCFGHACELHLFISRGASLALCESVDKIVPNLAEVKPTVLISVPRIFGKIYDSVNRQMQARPAVVQSLFQAGLRLAGKRRTGALLSLLEKVTLGLADRLIFSKIQARFGGRLKFAISGGSALAREVGEFVDSLGITIFEGYGVTETSPLVSVNCAGANRIGSVGKPVLGVSVTIDTTRGDDGRQGEIVVHGPNVMVAYHHHDQENREAFTPDGGFRTGDLGYLDDDGFVYVTGRLKEQYKLENGKYVAPAPLEEKIKLSPFISQAVVYGANKLYNVALIVPDLDAVKRWAPEHGLGTLSDSALVLEPQVKALIQAEVDKASAGFKGFERIKRIALTAEDFTMQNGMLTPSLKVKRRVVWQKYGPTIEALYAADAAPEKVGVLA